jgi:hypothetical protein
MSVNVEVKNFDVNTGLEASVNIDGDIFTINIDPESVQKVLYSDPVALDLTDVSDSVRSDNKSVDSEGQGELTKENLAQLSQGSNVNNGYNVVSEDSKSSESSTKNPMRYNPQPLSDLPEGAAGAGQEPNDLDSYTTTTNSNNIFLSKDFPVSDDGSSVASIESNRKIREPIRKRRLKKEEEEEDN